MVDFLDPAIPFGQRDWCVAYAFTYIYSTRPQKLQLRLGSDDGVVAWVNGREVWRNDLQRSLVADQDSVPVAFRKGWNRLLLKISQGLGAWSLQARLAPTRGAGQVQGIRFSLRRPPARLVPGLAVRENGLVAFESSPRLTYQATDGTQVFTVSLRVFNDDRRPSGRVQLELAGGNRGMKAARAGASIRAFTSQEVSLRLPVEKAVEILAGDRGAPVFTVRGDHGAVRARLGAEAGPRAFLAIMGGFPVKLPQTNARDGTFQVPPLFRGQPALVEVYTPEPQALTREVKWPAFASEVIPGKETRRGRIPIRVRPPRGVPAVAGRVLFGGPSLRAAIDEVAFLAKVTRADLGRFQQPARQGLAAVGEGSFRRAARAVRLLLDQLRASLPDRKREQVHLVGHAHIDMNWLWTHEETVQCCQDTFRQVLRFMEEFPEFCFSQSQASTYAMIEDFDPELFDAIRRRVKEGRWELLGGGVDEGDTNLSSGEGICRTFLLGQRYFRERFGRIARVGWLPDNFGHVAQLPQLLRLAGMDFFYGHRCQPKQGPYVWEGIDGSRVLNFATPTYNGEVTPDIIEAIRFYNPKRRKMIWVYGVGDHGGGPTRRDITRAIEYDRLPGFPRVQFSTAEKFFRTITPHTSEYPVFKGELQYAFEGCYTSIARIKEANRRVENTLYTGELFSALGSLLGHPYPAEDLDQVWYVTSFNQFHDILCGSATHESNRESISRYDLGLAEADRIVFESLRRWAEAVDTRLPRGAEPEGAQPVVVFNPLPIRRTDVVEAEIFAHQPPPSA